MAPNLDPSPSAPLAATQLAILLVEDSKAFAESVREYLQVLDHVQVVGLATNGPQAIDLTLRLKPDLVLMDISLGGMNGFEIAPRLRGLHKPPAVIFLSMHDSPAYAQRALSVGALGLVSKSRFVTDLIPQIEALIVQHQQP